MFLGFFMVMWGGKKKENKQLIGHIILKVKSGLIFKWIFLEAKSTLLKSII